MASISAALGFGRSSSTTTSTTQSSGSSTTSLSGTSTASTSRFDAASKRLLDAFTGRLFSAGEDLEGFSKEDAIADVAGIVENIFRRYRDTDLPQILSTQRVAGVYNDTATQQLADNAFAAAVGEGAAVVQQAVTDYAQLQASNRQMNLAAMLQAFQLQGMATEQSTEALDQSSSSSYVGTTSTRTKKSSTSLSGSFGIG